MVKRAKTKGKAARDVTPQERQRLDTIKSGRRAVAQEKQIKALVRKLRTLMSDSQSDLRALADRIVSDLDMEIISKAEYNSLRAAAERDRAVARDRHAPSNLERETVGARE